MTAKTGSPVTGALTVLLPARNEGPNLRPWWAAARPSLPPGTRILVVVDSDSDDTNPAVRALAAEGAPFELLLNSGAGFGGAVLTGLAAAGDGPVLVTMADGSDDLSTLPAMLAAYAGGAQLVAGSRFARGGGFDGGPLLKRALAGAASRSLVLLAGFPLHDATNSFRLYDAAFARALVPRPGVGTELAFAFGVEAWRRGARLAEVPTTWRDRSAGRSSFRFFRSLPRYGRIWLHALRIGLARRAGGGSAA